MIEVRHQPGQSRFIVDCDDGPAVLEYSRDGNTVDFHRTWVPPSQRGGRMALMLVRAGLAWAGQEELDARASCWYVQRVLDNRS